MSVGFPRQEYWSGLPFSSLGDVPNPGIELMSPALQADSLPLGHLGSSKTYKYMLTLQSFNLRPRFFFFWLSLVWACCLWVSSIFFHRSPCNTLCTISNLDVIKVGGGKLRTLVKQSECRVLLEFYDLPQYFIVESILFNVATHFY